MSGKALVEIQEYDNGWIVCTNYFAFGTESRMVFNKWEDVEKRVREALRLPLSTDRKPE